jgi:hypothetical protein
LSPSQSRIVFDKESAKSQLGDKVAQRGCGGCRCGGGWRMFVERSAIGAKPYTDDQLCAAIEELLNAGSAEESQHKQR